MFTREGGKMGTQMSLIEMNLTSAGTDRGEDAARSMALMQALSMCALIHAIGKFGWR